MKSHFNGGDEVIFFKKRRLKKDLQEIVVLEQRISAELEDFFKNSSLNCGPVELMQILHEIRHRKNFLINKIFIEYGDRFSQGD